MLELKLTHVSKMALTHLLMLPMGYQWIHWTKSWSNTNDFTPRRKYDSLNTLRPRQNGRHFADDTFKSIFVNKNIIIFIEISLNFVPKGPNNNIPALVR